MLQKIGQWFLVLFAMIIVGALICELLASSILLQALGKFNSPWTNAVNADTVQKWVNATWLDCCYFTNGTARTVYTCWTAQHSSVVTPTTCADEPLFYDEFTGWLRAKLLPAAAVALTFFLLQFIVSISAFCALCEYSVHWHCVGLVDTYVMRIVCVD